MEEKIMSILEQLCGAGPGELEPELDLFESGLLDSFGVARLLVELEEQLQIVLDIEQLTRREIATPALLLERLRPLL